MQLDTQYRSKQTIEQLPQCCGLSPLLILLSAAASKQHSARTSVRVRVCANERRLRNPPIPHAAAGRPKPAARGLCAYNFARCAELCVQLHFRQGQSTQRRKKSPSNKQTARTQARTVPAQYRRAPHSVAPSSCLPTCCASDGRFACTLLPWATLKAPRAACCLCCS